MGTNIIISRGDTPSFEVSVTDNTLESAFNLTDYTMRLTVKNNPEDTDEDAIIGPIEATIVSPTTGVGLFELTAENTDVEAKDYYYDVQIDNGTNVFTVIRASKGFEVVEDITKTTG